MSFISHFLFKVVLHLFIYVMSFTPHFSIFEKPNCYTKETELNSERMIPPDFIDYMGLCGGLLSGLAMVI